MQAFSSHDIFQTLYQQIMLLELKPGSTLRENALCYLAGNASGCHMPNMRDSKHRPLQMICSVCCNQQGFHRAGEGP